MRSQLKHVAVMAGSFEEFSSFVLALMRESSEGERTCPRFTDFVLDDVYYFYASSPFRIRGMAQGGLSYVCIGTYAKRDDYRAIYQELRGRGATRLY